jgi:hypothetical protein
MLQRHPLLLTTVRKSLAAVADCLAQLEAEDADMYLSALREELKDLLERDTSSMAWGQVVSQFSGSSRYGLERIGLLPKSDTR